MHGRQWYHIFILLGTLLSVSLCDAAPYEIDNHEKGMHAAVLFRIQHVKFSWLHGRFKHFRGTFHWDEQAWQRGQLDQLSVSIQIETESVDTDHATRDQHIRNSFLETKKYPLARFQSTSIRVIDRKKRQVQITGSLLLHGVTKTVTLDASFVGEGDFRQSHRAGFEGHMKLKPEDFGIPTLSKLGQSTMDINFSIEGIRQQPQRRLK